MAIPSLFKPSRELVNYDYFDIAEGVGYVIYFGARGDNGEYIVSVTSQLNSEEICTSLENVTAATPEEKKFDLDFDITFNRPQNIKGIILANIPLGVSAQEDTQKVIEYKAIVKAVHYDGSTETLLATGTSVTRSAPELRTTIKQFNSEVMLCRMDVATLKHFKKGETLRLTVEGWYRLASGSGNVHEQIGHDPRNRPWQDGKRGGTVNVNNELANEAAGGGTLTYLNTQMIFHVPFVLDI